MSGLTEFKIPMDEIARQVRVGTAGDALTVKGVERKT